MMRAFGSMIVATALVAGPASGLAPASGTIEYRATATYSDGSSADRLYAVRLDADSDGDGIGDEAWLRVMCTNEVVTAVYYYTVKSPRDAATGQASGKRMHKPFTITKEWGPSTPMLGKTGAGGGGGGGAVGKTLGWDLATGKGARVDPSRASNDSAGKDAKMGYDVKKAEGTGAKMGYDVKKMEGARVDHTGASDASAGGGSAGADRKTMAHDSWMTATLKEGSPNLCD
ncbi:MAG: hypothetical protein ABIP07_00100 [Sphingomicrobium sp.]